MYTMWRNLRPKLAVGSIINRGNQDINNQYVSGSGVGAMPTSVRRALKRRASKTCCDSKPLAAPEEVGSISFNGVDQHVSVPNAQVTPWLPGTGDFTLEWFVKKGVDSSLYPRVFALGYDTTAILGCSIEGGTCYVWPYGGNLSGPMPAGYVSGADWAHVAVCRSSGVVRLFLDGAMAAAYADVRNITDALGFDLNIGVDDPSGTPPNWWAGLLTNFRWTNSAVYTSAFTVPTAPLPVLPFTNLLLLGGTLSNPVGSNVVNHGAVWNAGTPFV